MKMSTNDTVVGNLLKIKNSLPDHVTLIAVSKNHSVDVIKEILPYHNILGENRVQEMMAKKDFLPGARWHMIGHLQTNKVKYIVPFIEMIHSVDSIKLLKEIEKHAAKNQRKIPVLIEIHIAKEESKYGIKPHDAGLFVQEAIQLNFQHVEIAGLMGMATYTEDMNLVRQEFRLLKELFETLKKEYFSDQPCFKHLSMGMSHDYQIAIEEGATMVRIGSAIFGERK